MISIAFIWLLLCYYALKKQFPELLVGLLLLNRRRNVSEFDFNVRLLSKSKLSVMASARAHTTAALR